MVKNELSLKACPRCGGDLYISRDMYGEYQGCIQCGYMKDLDVRPKVGVGVKSSNKEAA